MVMPRYQRAGVRIAGLPQISTAGLQEAARTSETLARNLDRVSNFAFRQAEVQAREEGREYGALNAPTQQQLQDAISAGEDPSELLPGDQSTAFGRAARGTALEAMALQFESQAREEIVNLQTQFENEQISLDELGTNFDALVSQQTEILNRVSPLAAQKFSASIGTVTNAAYLSAAKTQASRNKADYEISIRAGVDSLIGNIEYIVRGGDTVDEDGNVVTVEQKIDASLENIALAGQELNDVEFYNVKSQELREAYEEAQIGVVMDEAMLRPAQALRVFYGDGEFEDPDVQRTFLSMSNEVRRETFSKVNSALSEFRARENFEQDQREKAVAETEEDIRARFQLATLQGDMGQAEEILQEAQEFDVGLYNDLYEVYTTDPGVDNREVVSNLDRMALDNALTRKEIDEAFSSRLISIDTRRRLLNKLDSQRDEGYQAAVRWVKNERGYPPPTMINLGSRQAAARHDVGQILAELEDARQRDPSINSLQFVKDKVQELIEENGPSADSQVRFEAEQYIDQIRTHRAVPDDASAQEILTLLRENPSIEPNDDLRTRAVDTLLPSWIQMERRIP